MNQNNSNDKGIYNFVSDEIKDDSEFHAYFGVDVRANLKGVDHVFHGVVYKITPKFLVLKNSKGKYITLRRSAIISISEVV